MNYLNDSNWLGRTPRTLQQSKFGAHAEWEGYDNESRPTFGEVCAIVLFIGAGLGVLFIGPMLFGAPF